MTELYIVSTSSSIDNIIAIFKDYSKVEELQKRITEDYEQKKQNRAKEIEKCKGCPFCYSSPDEFTKQFLVREKLPNCYEEGYKNCKNAKSQYEPCNINPPILHIRKISTHRRVIIT